MPIPALRTCSAFHSLSKMLASRSESLALRNDSTAMLAKS
jgi:hypothetical protein